MRVSAARPRPRPPFPSVKGLWGKPSCVNNVETLANVPRILLKGAEWFAAKGTEKSKGTKVFALTGKIAHNGLVEVPMGITIREIVETIGGGTGTERKVKGVQDRRSIRRHDSREPVRHADFL